MKALRLRLGHVDVRLEKAAPAVAAVVPQLASAPGRLDNEESELAAAWHDETIPAAAVFGTHEPEGAGPEGAGPGVAGGAPDAKPTSWL